MSRGQIRVEVVYALPLEQDVTRLTVSSGTTVGEAIARSGVTARHPEIALEKSRVAIYGCLVPFDSILRDQDRVDILRPLTADPKEARRTRALRRLRGQRAARP